jgi:NADH dehydrogenase/NADH:ubiquinone oxidoreductase subunit G
MGALTLKSFPFELRGWDIEKFESIDPTDGFGSNTRVYISKDQIIQIEPDYNVNTFNTWLTDKGRQFYDGIFGSWSTGKNKNDELNTKSWSNIIKTITKTLYMFEHCNNQRSKNHFFTIVFENVGLEVLSLLIIISQNYPFIVLKRAENVKLNNDLESNFQLNAASDKTKLSTSTLCLLISNNPRYEGYYLNLNLRQRFFKGNFKCLAIGSVIDLTFPISFLGSNLNTIRSISEGNHFICQDIKSSVNPMLVINSELLKRNDGNNTVEILKMLKYANIFNTYWNGFNLLTPSLSETGNQSVAKLMPLSNKDLLNFSALYFLNVATANVSYFKKLTEAKLLNYSISNSKKELAIKKLFLDQNSNFENNLNEFNKLSDKESKTLVNYFHLPNSMFYENEDTFINTEGLVKRTTKLIFRKKTKNNWQILRKFFKQFKTQITFINEKNNNIIFFNSKKINNFKNFIHFHFIATQSLTNLNFYLNIRTKPFILNDNSKKFKSSTKKIYDTKLKYWLDDFFSGGKDEYSQNSLILTNCSKILRTENTNFF